MSLKIEREYFENNLIDQSDLFQLSSDGTFYTRTISENDLELSFDDITDGERYFYEPSLTYSLPRNCTVLYYGTNCKWLRSGRRCKDSI